MLRTKPTFPDIYDSCLRRRSGLISNNLRHGIHYRTFVSTLPLREQQYSARDYNEADEQDEAKEQAEVTGAMSRRLAEMTEETLGSGGRTAQKAIDEVGFSEELKRKLEAKIQDSGFRSKNAAAFAQMDMPVSSKNTPLNTHTEPSIVQRR